MGSLARFAGLCLTSFCTLWKAAFAVGAYDGVWIGTEIAAVPGVQTVSAETWTIIYQNEPDTLYAARQDFNSLDELTTMPMNRQGAYWVLPQPITARVFGVNVNISSASFLFPTTTHLNSQYTFEFSAAGTAYSGTGSGVHFKQSCTPLGSDGASISNLSGAVDSFRCYRLHLPACATAFSVITSRGSGDADLHVAFGQPDFNYYYSEEDSTSESIFPVAQAGIWYIGLEGFESYHGVTLEVNFNVSDDDEDGVGDCIDLCPSTPANETVDASGCAASERDDDSDRVLNGIDNCPNVSNHDQDDNDRDGAGDVCDLDDDNDGLTDDAEHTQHGTDPYRADSDGDGISDGDELAAGTDPLVNTGAIISIINSLLGDD